MNRPRRWSVVVLVLAALAVGRPAWGQAAGEKSAEQAKPKWLIDRSLTLSPQAESRPALKYRLLPMDFDRKPGNAVPIYLRLVHEQRDETRKRWLEVPTKWNKLPLDRLPRDEARKFLKGHAYMLRQLDLGARRKRADWNYTLDMGDPIALLLPDMHAMRSYARLLVLQARLALADGDFAAALHTLETGFAFSRHVAQGPFLITGLVAVATANSFADTLIDLVERPDAPNLYWPLTALPRPLIGMRRGEELEQHMLLMQFPDLADLDRPRSTKQWDEVLARVRTEYRRILRIEHGSKPVPASRPPDEPADRSPDLETARKYLIEQRQLPAARVKEMPAAQVLAVWIRAAYTDYQDDYYKASYLPFAKARPLFAAARKRLLTAPDTEAVGLVRALLPALDKVQLAQVRLDRRIAALRVIEAVRLHAAAHGGKLPDKLSDVTVAPIPDDPGTGKPFVYQRDGATATLISTIPGEAQEHTGLRYRLTMRAR
jgi:hypothetical protein